MLGKVLGFSIEHRYLVLLGVIVVAAIGVYSLQRLPIDAVPDITPNQVQINTEVPGLSPVDIEKQVTYPLETALAGIPGLTYTRSLSRNGFSQVVAIFRDDVSIYFARQQVNERLIEARKNLPPGADPKMGAISTGLGEVFMWTVNYEHPDGKDAKISDGMPGWQSDGSYLTPEGQRLTSSLERAAYLRTVQDWIIRQQLKGLDGLAEIDAIGGFEKKYHVQPDPMKLFSYGLSFDDLIEAIKKNNISAGAGYIEYQGEAYVVRADGRIGNEDQIADIVVATRSGTPIHVHDVATVSIGKELRTGSASENGSEVVVGTALMLIGANSRTVAAAVDAKLKDINKTLPPDIRAKPVLNRTKLVDATIATVQRNLAEGAMLVIVVLFVLLGNIRAALITALAIPLSMLMAFTGMVQWNISGNLMSLGAIDFGLIVDGAVIIVENCLRRLAEKQHQLGRMLTLPERLLEVTSASKEMIQPSVFGQAIIITVYVPILSLTGVEGKMFHPMAFTVILALVSAFILSLTFIPAMVAVVIRGKVKEEQNFLMRLAERFYRPVLEMAIRRHYQVTSFAVGVFAASLFLFGLLGQEFVPTLDEKDIATHAVRIPSTSLTQSTLMQQKVEKAVKQFPEVAFVYSKTGTAEMAADPMPPNVSDTFIILRPQDQWPNPNEPKSKLIERIEQALEKLPGNKYEFTQPIQMRFNELISGVRSDVAIKVYGDKFDEMGKTAQAISSVIEKIPGAADVKMEQTEGLPAIDIDINRAAISRYGLNVSDIQEVVAIAVGGREAGLVFEGDRRFDILVRLPEHLRNDVSALEILPVPLPEEGASDQNEKARSKDVVAKQGQERKFLPLKELAKVKVTEGINQVSRENGKRRIVVQANVRGRDLGSFVNEAQQRIAEQVKIPAGQWLDWGGQFENLLAARKRLTIVVPVCLFLIFLLLFGAFNSVKYALLVFTGVPLGLTGGILSLWLRGMPFSISAAVGFIALAGVAVLNGLVMVTMINQWREEGNSAYDAVFHGSLRRLRPVLMTALVASLGFVPMALSTGTGAEVQRPLATVVIGGLISSTALTLLVLPALYSIITGKDAAGKGLKSSPVRSE
ncbi:MAG: CusA/CzcA family heavy metal efflux RND transporter [Desulfomonile tiedjei]|uniref:CusA/CzcA family heavy metal efflux RND transporter n=1 Tax=Desulfomonile tiedjei TaxID=2358 RepID=A0A9D6V187_9BACT|nr:CusA/CzcA family heavy metal efflux RND transporter [Desulfomonile tiedjei]